MPGGIRITCTHKSIATMAQWKHSFLAFISANKLKIWEKYLAFHKHNVQYLLPYYTTYSHINTNMHHHDVVTMLCTSERFEEREKEREREREREGERERKRERERERERERFEERGREHYLPCGGAVDEVGAVDDDEYDEVDFEAAGGSNNFDDDDAPSDAAVIVDDVIPSPPSPPVPVPVAEVPVELLVPNELKRSPNDDIRSPPRLPSPMSPRPPDDDVVVVGLKRDEPEGAAVEAEEEEAAEEFEVPFVLVMEEEE